MLLYASAFFYIFCDTAVDELLIFYVRLSTLLDTDVDDSTRMQQISSFEY